MLTPDTKELLSVLTTGYSVIFHVLSYGSNGTTIKGKGTIKHFTFERMDDGRINFDFSWGTFGHAGYYKRETLEERHGETAIKIAWHLIVMCLNMKTFANPDERAEAFDVLTRFVNGFNERYRNTADNFELTPSD